MWCACIVSRERKSRIHLKPRLFSLNLGHLLKKSLHKTAIHDIMAKTMNDRLESELSHLCDNLSRFCNSAMLERLSPVQARSMIRSQLRLPDCHAQSSACLRVLRASQKWLEGHARRLDNWRHTMTAAHSRFSTLYPFFQAFFFQNIYTLHFIFSEIIAF